MAINNLLNAYETNIAKKLDIIRLFNDGFNERYIVKETGTPKTTVHNTIAKYKNNGTIMRIKGSGRPRLLNDEDIRYLENLIDENPKISSKKMSNLLEKDRKKIVSERTIRTRLNQAGYNSRVPRKVPRLSPTNILHRNKIAGEWSNWTLKQWENVIFSDETKINLFSSDGRDKVWRKKCEELETKNTSFTVKHGGGSVMVWGCMAASGVGKLVFIDGEMDRFAYKNIIAQNLPLSKDILGLEDNFIFQQDNDPKHKSAYVTDYFEKTGINQLEWPSQSPDLNPIEHLWDHVKRAVRNAAPKTIHELKEIIPQIWSQITPDYCKKLVYTMPKRVEEVARAKGRNTSF